MKPPATGPSIGPMSAGIVTNVIARTRSDLSNVRTIVRRPTGTMSAPPMPCRIRNATRTWMFVERPQRREPSVKIAIADAKTRRVPNRSAIQPLTGMKTARLSV